MGQSLYNPNDGITGRDGGPYLDEVQAHEAEKARAIVEGRKPDLENPPATAGIQLRSAAQILTGLNTVNSVPSKQNISDEQAERFFARADDDIDDNVRVWSEIPDEAFAEPEPESATKADDKPTAKK